jgi:hypothetical protein
MGDQASLCACLIPSADLADLLAGAKQRELDDDQEPKEDSL